MNEDLSTAGKMLYYAAALFVLGVAIPWTPLCIAATVAGASWWLLPAIGWVFAVYAGIALASGGDATPLKRKKTK